MARSEAPQDPRPYVRISTDIMLNPKLADIDNPVASWAYVVSICYCGGSFTDGHFPPGKVLRLADADRSVGDALIEHGLWHDHGHDCSDCPQPKPGSAVVHDYLRHQRSAAEANDLTSKRREAGRLGARKRWSRAHESSSDGNPMASAIASAKQKPWQMDGKPIAEERRGEENQKTTSSVSSETDDDHKPVRDDVERLCSHLADRIEVNGSKRPRITKSWRDACRLMLDRDKRTEEQITRAIDWCQDDDFWRSNVMSMAALRKQYDRLRLAAQSASRRHEQTKTSRPSTTDQRVADAFRVAEQLQEARLNGQQLGVFAAYLPSSSNGKPPAIEGTMA